MHTQDARWALAVSTSPTMAAAAPIALKEALLVSRLGPHWSSMRHTPFWGSQEAVVDGQLYHRA